MICEEGAMYMTTIALQFDWDLSEPQYAMRGEWLTVVERECECMRCGEGARALAAD